MLASLTAMGQNSSSNAPLVEKEKEKKDSKLKKYSQKYSTNTNSTPQHDKYKRLKAVDYEQFTLCPMKIHHAAPEKGYDKLFFLKML